MDLYCGIGIIGLYVAPPGCRLAGAKCGAGYRKTRRCATEMGHSAEFHVSDAKTGTTGPVFFGSRGRPSPHRLPSLPFAGLVSDVPPEVNPNKEMTKRIPLQPGLWGPDLEIAHPIGEGGFALTYRAYQGLWKLPVALKELYPVGACRQPDGQIVLPNGNYRQAAKSFRQEATHLSRFCHPGIVRLLDSFDHQGNAYMLLELLQGITLTQLIEQNGPLDLETALLLTQSIGEALLTIHAGGLVHRDIKPDNLFITQDRRIVLIDFGLTCKYPQATDLVFAYSPAYSPPEQYVRTSTPTPQWDIYALAATLRHMLLGKRPPDAFSRLHGTPFEPLAELRPDLPEPLVQVIEASLHLDAQHRPSDLGEFLDRTGFTSIGKIHLPSVPQLKFLHQVEAHPGGVYSLELDETQQQIYSTGRDGFLRIWSWPQLDLQDEHFLSDQAITASALFGESRFASFGCQTGLCKIQLLASGLERNLLDSGPPVGALQFAPQGPLLCAQGDGQIKVYRPDGRQEQWSAHLTGINALALHTQILASGSEDGLIHLWKWPNQEYLASLTRHTKAVRSLAFSPDGNFLVSASNDFSACLWNHRTGECIREFRGHRAMVWNAKFTNNPLQIATISADRQLRLFGTDSSRLLARSEAHQGWSRALTTSLQFPLAASGGADGLIKLWDLDPCCWS